ncbi:Gamma-cystathionase [Aphelenchoides fujianensis]|nr:Gamma-cystathionase [Aphelenchoides fujianensis]
MSAHRAQGFGTLAVHAGQEPEKWEQQQVVPSISMSTTYKQNVPGMPKVYDYARAGNPTRDALQENLAAMEKAQFCKVFSSGLATTSAIANLLKAGEQIICNDDGYGGKHPTLLPPHLRQAAWPAVVDMVDLTDAEAFRAALKPETKLVWFETPSNPLLKIRPLNMGVDIVIHSLTKYLNGHTDVVMGAAMTNREDLNEHLFFMQLAVGAIPSPFDCYLVNRGAKTLHLRMKAHMENGMAVAKWLEANPRVERVLYPELESHPQHKIHKKQATGMSGMISFYIRGGLDEAQDFLAALKIFTLAESLGGYESLAELPAVMTHASVPAAERAKIGLTDNLIRLSVGIEEAEDLIEDLNAALVKAVKLDEPTSPLATKTKLPNGATPSGITAVYA